MQIIDFLQTVKWILAQLSDMTKEVLLPKDNVEDVGAHKSTESASIGLGAIITATHELALAIEKFKVHPFAPEVLKAFDLELLLDPNFPVQLAVINVRHMSPEEGGKFAIPPKMRKNWSLLDECVSPLETLLIPSEVLSEQDFDEILTVELRYERERKPKAETVAEVLLHTTELYAAIARAHQMGEFPPLTVIFASSGSAFRFDLKGLGAPIKEMKELLVELWNKYRHRKAEDFEHNSNAFLSGLKVSAVIESYRQQGVVTDEDANRYMRQIMESGVALFNAGVLPREIPRVEVVSNQDLLEGIQRKLLPPAAEETSDTSEEKGKALSKRKAKSSRKSSRKSKK